MRYDGFARPGALERAGHVGEIHDPAGRVWFRAVWRDPAGDLWARVCGRWFKLHHKRTRDGVPVYLAW